MDLPPPARPDSPTCVVRVNGVAPVRLPDAEQIFTRYCRRTQSQVHPGIGIGLSLVRSTVVKIGGTIEYHPGNHRVTFIVRIPS